MTKCAAASRQHRDQRGPDFSTLEEPLAIADVLRDLENADVVVLDCLTLWLSNLLLAGKTPADIAGGVSELIGVLERRDFHAILVTNEVGLGHRAGNAARRVFRDVAGSAHQALSR